VLIIILKVIKAILLTTWLYSLLLWFYIVLRIIVGRVDPNNLFINSVPYLTFAILGMISFSLSFISLFVYLVLNYDPENAHAKL
jgi:hypothetical protein